ncbi:MAG: cyclin-like protein [Benniella sp.]|nr:MAG: cyclin-like protein [Benniella sp.]
MSHPTNRSRAPLATARRLPNDENIATGQPTITYVKDVASSMQASARGKAANTTSTISTTKKRALVEKSLNSVSNSSNSGSAFSTDEDKENINVARPNTTKARVPVQAQVKKQPAAPVQSQAPVQHQQQLQSHKQQQQPRAVLQERVINQLERDVVTAKKEAVKDKLVPHVPEVVDVAKSATKRVLSTSTTESVLPLLEGVDEARTHEEEENMKRPKRDEHAQWGELEDDDAGDPLMVSEYANQIFEYMQELEMNTMPDPNYMSSQKELAWRMRGVLIDWLAEVHYKFKLLPETLFLAVNLIDRFLSLRAVSMAKLQLVGVTSLFIAAKYEEVIAPSVQNFIYMSDGGFKDKEILQAERYMLQTLNFQLSFPSPMNFLRRISKADNYDIHSRTVAKYLMEIPLLDHNFLECPPSMISGAAICLARRMIGRYEWHENLVYYSGYTEDELMPCMERMVHFLQRPPKANSFIFRKYATRRFLKASVFCREWVLNVAREIQLEQAVAEGYETTQ